LSSKNCGTQSDLLHSTYDLTLIFTFILLIFHIPIFHLKHYVTISILFDHLGQHLDKDLDRLQISQRSKVLNLAFPSSYLNVFDSHFQMKYYIWTAEILYFYILLITN